MSAFERLTPKTAELEAALYGALSGCDGYAETVAALLAEEEAKDDPNDQLVHRLHQFESRIEKITRFIEDDALNEYLFLKDRLFAVDLAEKGEFI